MARLQALMGESRCGAPAPVDSWQPGACAMKPFAPREDPGLGGTELKLGSAIRAATPETVSRRTELQLGSPLPAPRSPRVALRRFRMPVIARVVVEDGRPARVVTDRRGLTGGRVAVCAGPWRTSGGWWREEDSKWDRDEWDVTLADRVTYRVYRERDSQKWFLDGVVD
jgi:hypothetical protein